VGSRGWPLPSPRIIDPKHWRDRAEEARLLAADMKNERLRETLLRIAKQYELLAERAQRAVSNEAPMHSNLKPAREAAEPLEH